MKCRRSLYALILVVFSTVPGVSSDNKDMKWRIQVEVDADGEINNQIGSYLTRELRSLPDVVIVDTDALWTIRGLAFEMHSQAGYGTGYAVSLVVLSPFHPGFFRQINEIIKADEETLHEIELTLASMDLCSLKDHKLFVCPPGDLKRTIEKFVTDFDATQLEPLRRIDQQMKDKKRDGQ